MKLARKMRIVALERKLFIVSNAANWVFLAYFGVLVCQVDGPDDNISVPVAQQIEGHGKIFIKNAKIMLKEIGILTRILFPCVLALPRGG